MAAPMSKKSLDFSVSDLNQVTSDSCNQAPLWFRNYEKRLQCYLDDKLDGILGQITACDEKLQRHDDRFASMEFECSKLQSELQNLRLENLKLADKIDDIENRGRRKNLVVFGLAETDRRALGRRDGDDEANGSVLKSVQDFFRYVGVKEEDLIAIERAHRTPTFRDTKIKKPRMIHIAFTTYVVKERVRKLCINQLRKSAGVYNENSPKVYVTEDLSKRVLQQRKLRMPEFFSLKEKGLKPFFTYPAKVCYRDQKTGKVVIVEPKIRNEFSPMELSTAQTQAGTGSETLAETRAETRAEKRVETRAEKRAESRAETRAEKRDEREKRDVKPAETRAEKRAETRAETRPVTRAETQAETRAETQAETRAETRAETQAEMQAETRAETQAETRAETQPE